MKIGNDLLYEFLKVFILGIIEGITEWLPVSSTGHLLLFDSFLTLDASESFKEVFFVVIQLGAIAAVVCRFWTRLFPFSFEKGRPPKVKKETVFLWCKVALALIPSVVAGVFLDDFIEERFSSPFSVALMLIAYGCVFILVETTRKNEPETLVSAEKIPAKKAFIIGLFQALALLPGTSRSGATVTGGLISGISRTAAAEFSFFLAVPTMLGASLFKIVKCGFGFSSAEYLMLAVGTLTAFVLSLLTVGFLMKFVKDHTFVPFGIYRIVLGVAVIAQTML